jgi:circadian clock protein KaiB
MVVCRGFWCKSVTLSVAVLRVPGNNGSVAGTDRAGARVSLRMYVASDSAPSAQARRQLAFLRERLGGEDWEIEVVDVFEHPDLAEADRILATPVLIRLLATRRLSVIGDFGDLHAVAGALDLEEKEDR